MSIQLSDEHLQTNNLLSPEDLYEYVNDIIKTIPNNHFSRHEIKNKEIYTRLKKFRFSIHQGLANLQIKNKDSKLCFILEEKFKEISYKYGQQSRRMRHWKSFQQVQSELRKFNSIDLIKFYSKIDDALFKSQCKYLITTETINYMGAMIIKKLMHLDKIRIHCIRTVNLCIGVVEMGHLLTILLFLITTLAEIASEAAKWYKEYKEFYLSLAEHFHYFNKIFPLSEKDIPYDSNQVQSQKPLKEVLLIQALANAPYEQSNKIAKAYMDELNINAYGVADEALKHLKCLKEMQHEEISKKVEESIEMKEEQDSVSLLIKSKKKRRR